MKDIQSLADTIASEFRPEKIILFGSHARGQGGPDSDVDLLVLMPYVGHPARKAAEIINRTHPGTFSLDVIVRTPESFWSARTCGLGLDIKRQAAGGSRRRVLSKRLAGRATCHEINGSKISEADFSDIRFDDVPIRAIEPESRAGIPIALNERNMLETRGFKAEGQAAST